MKTIKLNQNIEVSRIIQGTMNFSRNTFTPKEVMEMMVHRLDHGVTTFDTAQIYGSGDNEVLLGEALRLNPSLKKQTQWISKTGIILKKDQHSIAHYDTRSHSIITSCEQSLEKLGLESLDVFLIHREDPLIGHEEVAHALDECMKRGYIKSYGVSNFDPHKFDALQHFTKQPLVTNQIEFSVNCFEHIDNGNFDFLQKHHVHPLIWSPLAQGRVFISQEPEYQQLKTTLENLALKYNTTSAAIALSFIMHHPIQAIPIIGTTQNHRFESLLESLDIALEHEDWYRIYTAHPQRRLR